MSTGTVLGRWLGSLLTRLAAGATPVDGTHEAGTPSGLAVPPQPAARSRHFAAGCEVGPARGQLLFVRGLC